MAEEEEEELTEEEIFNAARAVEEAFPWLAEIPGIFDLIVQGIRDELPDEVILANIRASGEYKKRFAGMKMRKDAGFNPMNEYEYLALEDAYRTLLLDYGVLGILAPGDEAFTDLAARWIGGDVSAVELSARLDKGYAAMKDSSEEIKEAFRDFYGVEISDEQLLAYFLDQGLGLDELEQHVATATIGGAAYKYGLNVTRTRADILRKAGITGAMAQAGYADIAREMPQLETLARMHHYNPLSQEDLEDFIFHDDPNIVRERRRIFDTALADFEGAGATSVTRKGALGELVDIDPTV